MKPKTGIQPENSKYHLYKEYMNYEPASLKVQQKKKMYAVGILAVLCLSCLCIYLLSTLVKFFDRVWWTPIRIQSLMDSQGIKGPPYRFLHGNTKEMFNMQQESLARSIGLSHDILSKVQPQIYTWCNKYGMNFLHWMGPRARLVVMEPDLIKEILNDRDRVYPKPETLAYVKKLLGDGLVTSKGEKWAMMRKLANYAFHGESLKGMNPAMIAAVEMMLEKWKHYEGKEIDVSEEFRLLTSEIISRTAFGNSYLEGKNVFEMLRKLSVLVARNAFKFQFPGISKIFKTKDEIEADKLEKGIRDSVIEIIKKREEEVKTGELDSFGNDFLGLLVHAYHDADKGKRITVDDLVDECKTFYIAGQETTHTMLQWTVLLLAIHTDWQEEARKEVLKVFGHQNPNPDGITKLKTMTIIINESLRLYPPVVGMARKTEREVRLGKLKLPADIDLYISSLAIHHDPQIWGKDANLFKPDRFSEGVAKATNNNAAAFIPFGLGARNCVGFNFAAAEAKIALSMILQRYSFTLSPAYVHSPFNILTVCPQHGLQIIIQAL